MVIFGEKKIFSRDTFLFLIFGFFTFGAGYIMALQLGESFSSHEHSSGHNEVNDIQVNHNYSSLEITDNIEFDFELIQENSNNWNIVLDIKGLKFSPENVGKQHVNGQGHAHVFVDGRKHGRMYSNWYYLGPLDLGSQITVTLNSNNHKVFFKNGKPIEISRRLTK
ncbi:MAG: hypothetical protein OSA10_00470 [Paracoccaceae bacterium]|nr:hypothetical protein [Paracoccaceae bacterium]